MTCHLDDGLFIDERLHPEQGAAGTTQALRMLKKGS